MKLTVSALMRERLEDLGRIAVKIENLLEVDLFDEDIRPIRPKDVFSWFSSLDEEGKDKALRRWAYGVEDVSNALYEILAIANGETDALP